MIAERQAQTTVREPLEIEAVGLCKAFGERRVLRGVDLAIRRGEAVALVGGSGCGKTVLLNLILGQLVPDAGRVRVANHERAGAPLVDLAEQDAQEIARIHTHWGVVFQRNALFSGNVRDNIALWLREVRNLDDEAIDAIARSVLGAVDLPADAEFMERDVELLSGGMAKRLAVARALSMDPAVIFYDEPTTGLDPSSASHIHDLIDATHRAPRPGRPRRASVIVTHDKDLLRRLGPRVVMLHDGGVFFDGSLDDFAANASPIVRPYFDLMPLLHRRAGQS